MRTFIVGTIEYLDVPVTCDVTLNTQPVHVSLDQDVTWLEATWQGVAGNKRIASVLLGDANPLPPVGVHQVRVKVTDSPEIPIMIAGGIRVVP
jgi:hypothetical protein